ALGPHRRDLLPQYLRWVNDFKVHTQARTRVPGPTTLDSEQVWYEKMSKHDPSEATFTIFERATRRAMGIAGLHDIDPVNRTARFAILIGERDCWGRGYGTETTRLMLDY